MLQDLPRHTALSAHGVARSVGVEHVKPAQSKGPPSNGSFVSVIGRPRGTSISSSQVPSISMNSFDHSSAGSRITRRPSSRPMTSLKPLGKLHDFGKRTAWLPPFVKIFALVVIVTV